MARKKEKTMTFREAEYEFDRVGMYPLAFYEFVETYGRRARYPERLVREEIGWW